MSSGSGELSPNCTKRDHQNFVALWPSLIAAISSGLLLSYASAPYSWRWATFLSLVPLVASCCRQRPWRAFFLGWVAGSIFQGVAFSWSLQTIARFEESSTAYAFPFFLLFIIYHGIQFAIFASSVAASSRSGVVGVLSIAGVWTLLEWAFPRVFPWYLADGFTHLPSLRQFASIGGTFGLSYVAAITNVAVGVAVGSRSEKLLKRLTPIVLAVVILLSLDVFGRRYLENVEEPSQPIQLTLIQGGLESGRSDLEAANEEAWQIHRDLSIASRNPDSDLIVWPETTLRVHFRGDLIYRRRVSEFLREIDTPLFFGSLDLADDGIREINSAFLMSKSSSSRRIKTQLYHKTRLLPFGEYVPLADTFTLLQRWQTTGRFIAGRGRAPLTLSVDGNDHAFAPSICFEAIWAGAFNDAVRQGATFLLNITDDGWFGKSREPYQHLNGTIMRAIETRRWLVRASNSGVSAVIDPSGEVVASMPLGAVAALHTRIGSEEELSPYLLLGDWPLILATLFLALQIVLTRKLAPPQSRAHDAASNEPTKREEETTSN